MMRKPHNGHERVDASPDSLRAWAHSCFNHDPIIVLANREPYSHDVGPDGCIRVQRSTSGVVTAVEPLIRTTSGIWVAHGSGPGDRLTVDSRDGVDIPPGAPSYRLRRVWLTDADLQGYYDGFANEGLWPLCHRAHVRPIFRPDDFNMYWSINSRFVDALCDETHSQSPIVLVQDYHFALAPHMIRECLPFSTIVTFWHIPWPTAQAFEICPWRRQLIEGLLAANILGFQTPADCVNFMDTAEHTLKGYLHREDDAITYAGNRTTIRAYPASIEWPGRMSSETPVADLCRGQIRRELNLPLDHRIGVGVARLDYTKGIEETFGAVERLLESSPEYRGAFTYVQLADPSRTRVPAYKELRERVAAAAERVNRRFGQGRYRPVRLLEKHHEPDEVSRYLRAADLCYVGSLHDGMNLVAKEFVAARNDERGALILSAFTGAAWELTDALIVNPYDIDEAAHTLVRALSMSVDEQRARMVRMRAIVAANSAHRWAGQVLTDVADLRAVRAAAVS